MADKKQLTILKKGLKVWNAWRKKNPKEKIDLQNANLRKAILNGFDFEGADLSFADLEGSQLREADLYKTDVSGSNFDKAILSKATFSNADLTRASFFKADLREVDFYEADLSNTDLRSADLTGAVLFSANLSSADLHHAILNKTSLTFAIFSESKLTGVSFNETKLGWTHFGLSSLEGAVGLETCTHEGPSSIDHQTLMASGPLLPEVFLRGCGLPDDYITYLPEFRNQPMQFFSCFISYSHKDKSFARRLHDKLQRKGIRCWLDDHQVLPGDHIHREVDEAIRLWDKVLLCCSENSLKSWWVDKEIEKALRKEEELHQERGKHVLAIVPLDLDGYMSKPGWVDWKRAHLMSRRAADFTGWEHDNAKFEAQLEKVVKALRADGGGREKAPKGRL
jgi:uncharacterized protein YjbI with pentapeptide repeats